MRRDPLDPVFDALASHDRRRMLDIVQESPGMSIAALATHFEMSKVGVLKHVRLLESAGLVHTEKRGRERRLYFNVMPIQAIYDRWTDCYSEFWASRVADLKHRLESRERSVKLG